MTKTELKKCERLTREAIYHAKKSDERFKDNRENMSLTDVQKEVNELLGQNSLGYAEGIYQALVSIGFKHDQMKELNKLLN